MASDADAGPLELRRVRARARRARRATPLAPRRPEQQQRGLSRAVPRAIASCPARRQREVGRRKRLVEPRRLAGPAPSARATSAVGVGRSDFGPSDLGADSRRRDTSRTPATRASLLRRAAAACSAATSVNDLSLPDGHSTVSVESARLAPRPKSSSFECCDRNPDPACTIFVRRSRSVSTIDLRANRVAVARGAGQTNRQRRAAAARSRCGTRGAAAPAAPPSRARSGSPSRSTSSTANDRPS